MRHLSFLIATALFILFSSAIKAQYIPDSNFAAVIQSICPTCIDGNHYLTADAQTLTNLTFFGDTVPDLTGVDGFVNLDTLRCNSNHIINIPALPPHLKVLNCVWNNLNGLPALPSSLRYLDCRGNYSLFVVPTLPDSLTTLICSYCSLHDLPQLPLPLEHLECGANYIDSIHPLPANLKFFGCAQNDDLTSYPSLPSGLKYFNCTDNPVATLPVLPSSLDTLVMEDEFYLTAFPTLPQGLLYLDCGFLWSNIQVPDLPDSLTYLNCSYSEIGFTSFPSMLETLIGESAFSELFPLPSTLKFLDCNNNSLTSLPPLPDSLTYLDCGGGMISALPPLPSTLQYLYCGWDSLTALPALPNGLKEIDASSNKLLQLPPLPDHLTSIYVGNNLITSVPYIPSHVAWLDVSDNPLTCLPILPDTLQILGVSNTNILCLPNVTSFVNWGNLPICTTGNINGCVVLPLVEGKIFFDANANGILDSTENSAVGVIVSARNQNSIGISDEDGNYVLALPMNTSDTIVVPDFSSYYLAPSTFYTVAFDTSSAQVNTGNDFGILPLNIGSDISVSVMNGRVRPGFDSQHSITVHNIGSDDVDGSLTLTFDSQLSYVSASDTPASVIGNEVTWDLNSFHPIHSKTFLLTLFAPPGLQVGSHIVNEGSGTITSAADIDFTDNTDSDATIVVSSFDPNEKEVNEPEITQSEISNGGFLEYTIRFQNTGTAEATFIYVIDTLSSNLDASTFQMIAASHDYDVTLANDLTQPGKPAFVKWLFNNINLPDSADDFSESQGFVQFKIKPKAGLTLGEFIDNTAFIYFDYNAPVNTNTISSVVTAPENVLAIKDGSFYATIYPNPAGNTAFIHFASPEKMEVTIKILDEANVTIQEKSVVIPSGNSVANLSLVALSSGIYLVRLKSKLVSQQTLKLVKD
ncbi:MAG TPA: T9SS type A sorting domain-containing protein [Chitinophagales bacterium]|nr:T9SS type A sorting domain-containing protein [Chitinophagales bacterium]